MVIHAKNKSAGRINFMLNEDLLALILSKINGKLDRDSFSLVCKQWLGVQRLSRNPYPWIYSRFPNLVDFGTWELTTRRKKRNKRAWHYPGVDTRLEFIAKTCPKLDTSMVRFKKADVHGDVLLGLKGLRALGTGCSKFSRVIFQGMKVVGNPGVDALCHSVQNLKALYLGDNILISDQAFRAIGLSSISTLELEFCHKVTDEDWSFWQMVLPQSSSKDWSFSAALISLIC